MNFHRGLQAVSLVALGAASSLAAEDKPVLVNLARLSIARVAVSGGNGERPSSDRFYGARTLFDAGTNIVNGIVYTKWASAGSANWALVRFSQPVTVAGVAVEIPIEESVDHTPRLFQVMLRGNMPSGIVASPRMEVQGERSIYVPHMTDGVTEVMVLFDGPDRESIEVREVEVYGPPPAGVDLTPMTPPVDADLDAQMSASREDTDSRRLSVIHPLAQMQLEEMRGIRGRLDRATTKEEKAKAWFELNVGADRLWLIIGRVKSSPTLQKAAKLGVSFPWCEFDGALFVNVEGYEKYLELWPTGPEADEAWWRSKLAGPACSDFEGTREEYEGVVDDYSEFLKKFPKSRHAPEARQRVEEATKALKSGS